MADEKDKDKIIPFPGTNSDSELGDEEDYEDESSLLPVPADSNALQPLDEIIDGLAKEEVVRMSKNLFFLDFLEDTLRTRAKESIDMGLMDLETLQKIIGTFNKSVKRSNDIIKDKDSDLIQILVDARSQTTVQNQMNLTTEDTRALPQRSRKKLQKLINAIMSDAGMSEESIIDAEVIEDEEKGPDENI